MPLPLVPLAIAAATSGGLSLGADALLNRDQAWTMERVLTTLGIGAAAGVVAFVLGPKLLMVVAAALAAVGIGLAVKVAGNLLAGRGWNDGLSWAEIGRSAAFASAIALLCWAAFKVVPALRPPASSPQPQASAEVAPPAPAPAPGTPAPAPPSPPPASPPPPPPAPPTRIAADSASVAPPGRGMRGALLGEEPSAGAAPPPAAATAAALSPADELAAVLREQVRRVEERAWNLQRASGGRGPNDYSAHMSDLRRVVRETEAYLRRVETYAAEAKRGGVPRQQFVDDALGDLRAIARDGLEPGEMRAGLGRLFDGAVASGPRLQGPEAGARSWFRASAALQRRARPDPAEVDDTIQRGVARLSISPWSLHRTRLWELSLAISRTARGEAPAAPGWLDAAFARAGALHPDPAVEQRLLPRIREYAAALLPGDGLPPP